MEIRLATLNAWALPLFARDVDGRLRAIGERLADLDLDAIAFQEVWTPGARHALAEAGRRAGLAHAWQRRRSLTGGGLLVLSRLPIEQVDFDRFALRGGGLRHDELLGRKGFARVRLRTPQGALTLFDTHLHAGTAPAGSSAYRAQRTAQIVQLAAEAREVRDPVVVLGDLNLEETDPEYRVLVGLLGLRDAAVEQDCREPTAARRNPYRDDRDDRRIDYVMVRDGDGRRVRTRSLRLAFDGPLRIDGRAAAYSNHAGVLAELALEPGRVSGWTRPAPEAIDLAARLLDAGAAVAREQRGRGRARGGAGIAVAALAATGRRTLDSDRRAFLRGSLHLGALAALAPGAWMMLGSEWLVPEELDGFRRARADLARIRAEGARAPAARSVSPSRR